MKWYNVDVKSIIHTATCFCTCSHCNLQCISTWPASFLEQSRSGENWAERIWPVFTSACEESPRTSHSWSFLFHSEAYGMCLYSGMHDSMGEELESAQGLGSVLLYAHGHSVAKQGLASHCWDPHLCFPRRVLHSWSVWRVLILFEESGCQQTQAWQEGFWLYSICLFCYKVEE